jgi:hypothetical protein
MGNGNAFILANNNNGAHCDPSKKSNMHHSITDAGLEKRGITQLTGFFI